MQSQSSTQSNWLRSYYFTRAIFSIVWIVVAVVSGGHSPLASLLLVIYPAWDALANLVDARSNGGLKANPSQTLNVVVSTITTIAVIVAVSKDTYAVLGVFGVWAILSGLLQLYTGVRRWRSYGAQWAMILSGGQSTLAGGFMISQSVGTVPPSILDIAPYAGFGAFYFLVSAIWLTVATYRKANATG
jgi:pheromone shutdown protein TraB